jgi:proline iminopeptidase
MKKMITLIASLSIVCLAVLAAGGFLLYRSFTGPMYRPGMVREGKDLSAPLDPPPQSDEPGVWTVEPDIRLQYFSSGDGKTALVLHGGPGYPFLRSWSGLQPLEDSFRFFYYDQRGCGRSTRPFDTFTSKNTYGNMQTLNRTLGLGAQVADIERIRRILGADKLSLVGHSFGGFIAALYATECPERVERLVLVSPADMLVMPQEDGGLFPRIRERLPESERAGFDAFMKDYLGFQDIFGKSEADLIALNERLGEYYAQAFPGAAQAGPVEQGKPGGWMVRGIYLSLGRHHDYRDAMRSTAFPVLILHGAEDLQSEETTRRYLEIYPQAEFAVIPGATHFAFEENAEEFGRMVGTFLD